MSGDSHGHDDDNSHGHGHGHDDHAPVAAPPPPAPAPELLPPPVNPATKEQELGVLQACFHVAARSAFVYFSEPGSLLVRTPDDRRLEATYQGHVAEDGKYADRIAELVRERGTEPQARAFPERFTRLNFLTYESAASYMAEDLAMHPERRRRCRSSSRTSRPSGRVTSPSGAPRRRSTRRRPRRAS